MRVKATTEALLMMFAVYSTVCAAGRKERLDRKMDMQSGISFFVLLLITMLIK